MFYKQSACDVPILWEFAVLTVAREQIPVANPHLKATFGLFSQGRRPLPDENPGQRAVNNAQSTVEVTDLSHASADHIGAAFDKSQNYSSCTSKVAAAPVFSQKLDGAFAHRPRLQTSRHPLGMGRRSGFPLNRSVSPGSGGCGCEIAKVLDDG